MSTSNGPDRTPGTPDKPAPPTYTVTCKNFLCYTKVEIPSFGVTVNLAVHPVTYQFICPACLVTSTVAIADEDRKTTLAIIFAGSPERVSADLDAVIEADRIRCDVYGAEEPPAWPTRSEA